MEDRFREYLYKIVRADGTTYADYKFDRILKKFEEDDRSVKLYAYTKRIKPTYILLFSKEVSLMAHFLIESMRNMAYTKVEEGRAVISF